MSNVNRRIIFFSLPGSIYLRVIITVIMFLIKRSAFRRTGYNRMSQTYVFRLSPIENKINNVKYARARRYIRRETREPNRTDVWYVFFRRRREERHIPRESIKYHTVVRRVVTAIVVAG